MKKKLVLFDFDGTLSAKDSTTQFGKHCFKHSFWPWLCLPLVLVGFVLSWFNRNGVFWRELVCIFMSNKVVKRLVPEFIKQHKPERFGWAKEQVAKEKATGNTVVCISAAPSFLINPLVKDMGFDKVITTLRDGKKPWKIKFLCYGKGKVVALDKAYKDYEVVRSYSDSKSDIPMMKLAREQVWINPKTGARV